MAALRAHLCLSKPASELVDLASASLPTRTARSSLPGDVVEVGVEHGVEGHGVVEMKPVTDLEGWEEPVPTSFVETE